MSKFDGGTFTSTFYKCMNMNRYNEMVKELNSKLLKKIIIQKRTTTIQICRLENIEHKRMKQVSYSGKYFLSASKTRQSHLQFSFVVGDAFCPRFLHV